MVSSNVTFFLVITVVLLSTSTSGSTEDLSSEVSALSYRLPEKENSRDAYTRSFSCFVFESISGHHNPDCMQTATGLVDVSRLSPSAAESLRATVGMGVVNINNIRHWWNIWAYSLRRLDDIKHRIPETLDEFREKTSFKSWPMEVVPRSHVKNKTRVIYRSTVDSRGLSVSETLNSTSGDTRATVLETEIVYERGDNSKNHDFYVYNSDGVLSNTAEFPAGKRAAPSVCMSCHYSAKTGKFNRVGR